MTVPDSAPDGSRVLGAALPASALVAAALVAVNWAGLFATGRLDEVTGGVAVSALSGWLLSTASFVPFLAAVLLVVVAPSRRTVAGGVAVVYVADLLLVVVRSVLSPLPVRSWLPVLAVPLTRVAAVLAVATAAWIAYHGGYDRVASALGNPDQHPLFAVVAGDRIGPDLTVRRGAAAAGLGAVVAAGGAVVAGLLGDLLAAVARAGATGSESIFFTRGQFWNVGIPLSQLPAEWLFEASFLLGVLFVIGPRLRPRDLTKGVAVVLVVQSTAQLLPALLPPVRPVSLWSPTGPVLGPLVDAVVLAGVATAVWLAVHGGAEAVRSLVSADSTIP
ncbi:hypothetical protein Hbl1158_06000 [Halobaculum sp. CBA1158]|uniref:hypothetical protein n=1 Tax=Halobaculum sp. CBA1158 TaxID=2904243 RepID=UPI001F18EA48|nr:hypothetical protein [Halobaculum sp. CBA1158]UIP00908.1 hypothetical protein Hbl1158_06000 [Halobaculum sp. CBA1158]